MLVRPTASPPAAKVLSPAEADDSALIPRIARGETVAFDLLFARHSPNVMTFLARLVCRRVDVDDLLQETFLRVLAHANTFKPGAAVRPWLYTIARNVAYDALKKRSRTAEPIGSEHLDVKSAAFNSQGPREVEPFKPEDSAEISERRTAVLAALEHLPPAHREVVVLGFLEQLSYEQIAQITGESEGTLRSRMFYALRKLRAALKGQP